MQATAFFLSIFLSIAISLLVTTFLLVLSAVTWRSGEAKAHARRLVDARMNARILRFNL